MFCYHGILEQPRSEGTLGHHLTPAFPGKPTGDYLAPCPIAASQKPVTWLFETNQPAFSLRPGSVTFVAARARGRCFFNSHPVLNPQDAYNISECTESLSPNDGKTPQHLQYTALGFHCQTVNSLQVYWQLIQEVCASKCFAFTFVCISNHIRSFWSVVSNKILKFQLNILRFHHCTVITNEDT